MNHLEPQFIEQQRKRLLEEKARVEEELSKIADKSEKGYKTKWSEVGSDEDDNAIESDFFAEAVSLEGNLEDLLRDITAALARIEEGTYGLDVTDGSPVSVERLEAFPAATMTVENEQKLEKKLRGFLRRQ